MIERQGDFFLDDLWGKVAVPKLEMGVGIPILILIVSLSCSSSHLLKRSIEESDLVGTWQSNYWDANGVDTLTLKADGTYQQVYEDSSGYTYKSEWNKWYLERLPDGRQRVHLEGMRYYPEGVEVAESQQPLYLFDENSSGDLIPGELMDGKLVLNVKTGAVFQPNNILLRHLSYRDDSSEPEFVLIDPLSVDDE
jgi:hypothetical protein